MPLTVNPNNPVISPRSVLSPLFADCQKQLKDYKENLEQLEGFQSQELAKVKHMLLSAETALEKETKTRKKLEKELETAKEGSTSAAESSEAIDALKNENASLKVGWRTLLLRLFGLKPQI